MRPDPENQPYQQLVPIEIAAIAVLSALASFVISLALLTLLINANVVRWRVLHDALNFLLYPAKYQARRRKHRNSIIRIQNQIRSIGVSQVMIDDVDEGVYVDLRREDVGDKDDDLPDFAKRDARVSRQIQFGAIGDGIRNDSDKTSRPIKSEKCNIYERPSIYFNV